jgi:diguanylate cyclase (GGDEF)-like protein
VPILAAGDLRAVLVLTSDLSSGAFTTDRLDAVQLVAGQLAVSLDNAMVYRSLEAMVTGRTRDLEAARAELEILSLTDPLTQVANRRRFAQVLSTEWATATATGRPLAVVMVDIDHFKAYNDGFGHPAGDACIRQVAAALRGTVRDVDLLARYGGEEFAVILPGVVTEHARAVAERMRVSVLALGFGHPADGSVSVSLGVASALPAEGAEPADEEALVDAADTALYRAKRNGRNRVEFFHAADRTQIT